jgi:hypothetical protein
MFCVVRTVRNRGDRRGERGSDQVAAHHQHLSAAGSSGSGSGDNVSNGAGTTSWVLQRAP